MFHNNRISDKFLKTVALFCFLFFSTVFTIQLYYEYNRELSSANSHISELKSRTVDVISQALWSYDIDYLRAVLEGMMNAQGIVGAEILDENGVIVKVGDHTKNDTRYMEFDVKHEYINDSIIIGNTIIYYDFGYINGKILKQSAFYFFISFLFVFMQGTVIFFLFHRNVSVNLGRISTFASRLTPENLGEPLELRRPGRPNVRDEMTDLADAINIHRERLLDALTGLKRRDRLWEEAEKLANIGYLEEDVDDGTASWSPGLFKILAIDPSGVAPTWAEYRALILPEDRERMARWRGDILEGGNPESTEHSVARLDGNIRRVRATGTLVGGAAGASHRLLLTIQDITERHGAEMRLRESEANLRALFDNMLDVFYRIDVDGRLTMLSPSALEMLGTPATKLVGRHIQELLWEPGDWQKDRAAQEAADGILRGAEFALRRADGQKVIVEINEYWERDDEGTVVGSTGVARDVTEKRQFMEELRRSRDELELRVVERTAALQSEVVERQYAEKALREANENLEQRVRERTSDLEAQIAARKQAEQSLVHAQKMEAVGQLAGGIAHDFNNLLTVIQAGLEIFGMRLQGNDESLRLLTLAVEAVERASGLTRRLLTFSRQSPLRVTTVDVAEAVTRMTPLIERALPESVELAVEIASDIWPLEADLGQLENSILNLAINARDAMPAGGKFSIKAFNCTGHCLAGACCETDLCGNAVRFAFTDTGTGMPPEVMEKAFNPFFTTKEAGKGTGLGLSMVYGFATQSRGSVRIESEMGQGTTVFMCLPRGSDPVGKPSQSGKDRPGLDRPSRRMLVVEDDPALGSAISSQIENLNHKVQIATTARMALDILANDASFDLILTDVVMPGGMNGIELCEVVQAAYPGIPIILMTGYAQDAFMRCGRKPEDFMVLYKPFGRADLDQMIERAMKRETSR